MDEVLNGKAAPENQQSQGTDSNLSTEFDLGLDDLMETDEEGATSNSADTSTDTGNASDGGTVDNSSDDEGSDEEDIDFTLNSNPTNTAFAAMRAENKQYKDIVSNLENLAKSLGYADANTFLAKANQRVADKKAQQSGVSPQIYDELQSLAKSVSKIQQSMEQQEMNQKGREVANVVQSFVNEHKMSRAEVDKLSKDLSKDGITDAMLFEMPKAALVRLLNSYTDKKQETINKKEQIRKEMPISQSSSNKVDVNKLNKDIDKFAKMLAGKE